MKTIHKFLYALSLLALLMLTVTTPALAFDGRGGENVVIAADEVVEDDVYVGATTFVLEGTVRGDLIVFAQSITINGTVEGDLIAAGQTVVINGTVTDDARIAGSILQLGQDAVVGSDLVSAGAALETRDGSAVEGEVVFAGGQALLAGSVTGDAMLGTGSLELRGEFGGDVFADVGEGEGADGPPPSMFMPQTGVSMPTIPPGFTITEDARIDGDLEYSQSKDIVIPAGVVAGTVTRNEPAVDPEHARAEPTRAQMAMEWTLDLIRNIITLVLFGLLLGWLLPSFMKNVMGKLQNQPAASLGWGLVSCAAFLFVLLLIVVIAAIGTVVFGLLTLGNISGMIFVVGLFAFAELILGFVLAAFFLAQIIVAWQGGKLILSRINPALAEHKVWPLLLGVLIVSLLIAIPFVGRLFWIIIALLGLGALWIWGRDLWQARKVTTA
jgi:cytoskeletal protein CcmA (bactofilin family)